MLTIIFLSVATLAAETMPVAQQNALIQKHCVVCHTDAARSGGLSLEHFNAATVDPSLAAMMVSKINGGAMGASAAPKPDQPTIAWLQSAGVIARATAARMGYSLAITAIIATSVNASGRSGMTASSAIHWIAGASYWIR